MFDLFTFIIIYLFLRLFVSNDSVAMVSNKSPLN